MAHPGGGAIAPIGALPAVPSFGAGQMPWYGQLGEAATTLPQTLQAQQLQQQFGAEQSADLGQKALERLTQAGLANPGTTEQPQYRAMVEHAAKMAGVPVVYSQGGGIDIQAMTPKRPMSESEQAQFDAMTPQEKQANFGHRYDLQIDPSAFALEPQITQGDRTQGWLTYRSLLDRVADPKSSGIEGIQDFAKSTVGKALFPNLADLANNPEFQQKVNQRADAVTQALVEKGIIQPQEMVQIRSRLADAQIRNMNESAEDRRARLVLQQRKMDQQQTQWNRSYGLSVRRLDQWDARLDQAQRTGNAQLMDNVAKQMDSDLRTAQQGLDSVEGNIRGYVTNGEDPPPDLIQQQSDLKTKLTGLQAKVDMAHQNAQSATMGTVRAATGYSNVQPVAPGGSVVRNGKTYYLNPSDGNYYLTPP